jgi:hypothetical protein
MDMQVISTKEIMRLRLLEELVYSQHLLLAEYHGMTDKFIVSDPSGISASASDLDKIEFFQFLNLNLLSSVSELIKKSSKKTAQFDEENYVSVDKEPKSDNVIPLHSTRVKKPSFNIHK